ncbi:hypothetical protein HDU76_007438 [Blyttiomyces sp. JEL0837]|nr:hypothetical protein HDU76_007438 [Blyttiomyces sp. JEL0837]
MNRVRRGLRMVINKVLAVGRGYVSISLGKCWKVEERGPVVGAGNPIKLYPVTKKEFELLAAAWLQVIREAVAGDRGSVAFELRPERTWRSYIL